MAWTHDDEHNTLRCVSEKHGRDLTIQLPQDDYETVSCDQCWRNCTFGLAPANVGLVRRMHHTFNPSKPQ